VTRTVCAETVPLRMVPRPQADAIGRIALALPTGCKYVKCQPAERWRRAPDEFSYFSTVVLRCPQLQHSRQRMVLPRRMGRV